MIETLCLNRPFEQSRSPQSVSDHKTKDTQDRILDSAELLFSEQGIAATSLRSITQRAGVNTAAIHYHFGDKLALIEAIVSRRIAPMNRERLKRLDELEAAGGHREIDIAELLRAYLGPVVAAQAEWGEGARKLGALMARLRIEQTDIEALFAHFQDLHDRYAKALARALPELGKDEAGERLDYATGAMIHLLMHAHESSESAASGLEQRFERMIHFLAAGFRAPSEPNTRHRFANPDVVDVVGRVAEQGART